MSGSKNDKQQWLDRFMHASVYQWTADLVTTLGLADRSTLEVGSYNVNGSVRDHFRGEYIGVDVTEGPGVDVVIDGDELPFPDATFDVVISTECFEHARRFWMTAAEMVRVCRPGGTLIVTARGNGFPHHNPPDRWRFMDGALTDLFADLGATDIVEAPDEGPSGVTLTARA